jgi:hypothetical protein
MAWDLHIPLAVAALVTPPLRVVARGELIESTRFPSLAECGSGQGEEEEASGQTGGLAGWRAGELAGGHGKGSYRGGAPRPRTS